MTSMCVSIYIFIIFFKMKRKIRHNGKTVDMYYSLNNFDNKLTANYLPNM